MKEGTHVVDLLLRYLDEEQRGSQLQEDGDFHSPNLHDHEERPTLHLSTPLERPARRIVSNIQVVFFLSWRRTVWLSPDETTGAARNDKRSSFIAFR